MSFDPDAYDRGLGDVINIFPSAAKARAKRESVRRQNAKPEQKERRREWRRKNPEKANEIRRRWREGNLERAREIGRNAYHKAKAEGRLPERTDETRAKHAEYMRAYRAKKKLAAAAAQAVQGPLDVPLDAGTSAVGIDDTSDTGVNVPGGGSIAGVRRPDPNRPDVRSP